MKRGGGVRKVINVTMPKIFNGIFFEINFFGLEYVLKHSESILKKKIQKFWSIIFTLWLFWSKNGRVPEKNFQRGNFFEIDFFGLEYVLRHSESILKKNSKILVENFHFLVIFDHFWRFLSIFEILGQKSKKCFSPPLEDFTAVILSHRWAL